MKSLILISCFILSFSLVAQTNIKDINGLKQGEWVLSIDSLGSESKDVFLVCHYVNDTLDGDYKLYMDDHIIYSTVFSKGKKNGAECYYDQNSIVEIKHYNNDSLSSWLKFGAKNNVIESTLYLNGKMLENRLYFSNGTIQKLTVYESGVCETETNFDKKGKIRSIFIFDKGKLQSVEKY